MKISGIMPLRNAVKLGYPFELAIKSLRLLCDELVILVDPKSEDDTMDRVKALKPDKIIESVWDMNNHQGHTNCEITVQTRKLCEAASGDWIMSLQADEILHELEINNIRNAAEAAASDSTIYAKSTSAYSLNRIYFYGSLHQYRRDWTQHLVRLFQRGKWQPDVDGAMKFEPIYPGELVGSMPNARGIRWRGGPDPAQFGACIYHYSRIGDPKAIAERVRNLDGFFHPPEAIQQGELEPYDFSRLRKLDTYVVDAQIEDDLQAKLVEFPFEGHPENVRRAFQQGQLGWRGYSHIVKGIK